MQRPRTTLNRPRRRPVASLVTGVFLVVAAVPAAGTAPELDAGFGVGGVLRTNFGGTYDWGYALALQPDGKILAAGVSNALGTYDFALARYNPDGSLDTSFGSGGTVITDFDHSYDWAYAVALQPDGKIVAAGVSDVSGNKDFALARYHPDGSLDGGFGAAGLVVGSLRPSTVDIVHAVALQPDGRIVATGVTFEDAVSLRQHGDFMLARYTPDGAADPTFGIAGVVTTDFNGGSYEEPYALVLQPDQMIVVGGYANSGGGPGVLFGADDLVLVRYTGSGLLDRSFGEAGRVTVDLGTLDEEIRALALQADGRIVAAGYADGERRGDLVLVRILPHGALDPTFGDGGVTRTDLGSHSELLSGVALLPDGRIMAGGQVAPNAHGDFAVLRYDGAGRLDRTFGTNGLVAVDFGGREDRVHAVALQPDGKMVALGASEADFALARYVVAGGIAAPSRP